MHSALAFDTYSYVRKLRDAGVDEEQAVIQTEALVDLVEHRLASKQDVLLIMRDIKDLDAKITAVDAKAEMRAKDLDAKITALDAKMDAKITALEDKMDTKITALEDKMDAKITALEDKMDAKITALETKTETLFKELDVKITAVDTKITDTIKWMAGMYAAQTAIIIGAMFAMMKMAQAPLPVSHPPQAQEMRLPAPQTQEMRLPALSR